VDVPGAAGKQAAADSAPWTVGPEPWGSLEAPNG
jgi:hypothetical protein